MVAGLVVLGVLVASVTVARARAARQWADAARQLAAARALDALVARWLDGPTDTIPASAGGTLDGAPGCAWRTSVRPDSAARQFGAATVRVEVLDGRRTLLTLELLKRIEPRREPEGPP